MAAHLITSRTAHVRRWPGWVAPAAGVWSLVTALLGCYWLLGGGLFPFGSNDRRAAEVGSLFGSVQQVPMAAVVAAVGAVGVVVALVMAFTRRGWSAVGFSWLLGAVLMFAVPDIRVIQNFAYLFFGYTGLWDVQLLFMLFSMAGAVLWAGAGLVHYRRMRGRCDHCGRSPNADAPAAGRWGTWITYVAAGLALPYGIVRFAWALGIPLGISADAISGNGIGLRLGMTGLAALTFGGAILTIGLVRRWGEVFPRWIPLVGGRRVPVWFAVVPATWAAVLVAQAGLRILVWAVDGEAPITADNWGSGTPGLAFLPWGIALGLATYAYYLRRRGVCGECGLGLSPGAAGSDAAPRPTA